MEVTTPGAQLRGTAGFQKHRVDTDSGGGGGGVSNMTCTAVHAQTSLGLTLGLGEHEVDPHGTRGGISK